MESLLGDSSDGFGYEYVVCYYYKYELFANIIG